MDSGRLQCWTRNMHRVGKRLQALDMMLESQRQREELVCVCVCARVCVGLMLLCRQIYTEVRGQPQLSFLSPHSLGCSDRVSH